ncbi:MAG TPA: FhaA domain-containing protein [Candidatus Cybelea sp.]|nr:FhaA domain-containing protein [Candidatus Cybelea sp.]
MSFFAKIEQACATFIERAFAKGFPSDLEPAQIARKLVSTMEAQTRGDEGRLTAPSGYSVYVSPEDFERLAEHREYLERAWAELLCDLAARVGIGFEDGEARVVMAARASVPLGAIAIETGDAEEGATHFCLRMIKGVPPSGVYPILQGRTRIGRGDESEIVLVDPSVSRSHAVVEIDAAGPVVRDLDSTNGTFVNGRRITAQALRDGDELLFGNTKMRFEAP